MSFTEYLYSLLGLYGCFDPFLGIKASFLVTPLFFTIFAQEINLSSYNSEPMVQGFDSCHIDYVSIFMAIFKSHFRYF